MLRLSQADHLGTAMSAAPAGTLDATFHLTNYPGQTGCIVTNPPAGASNGLNAAALAVSHFASAVLLVPDLPPLETASVTGTATPMPTTAASAPTATRLRICSRRTRWL